MGSIWGFLTVWYLLILIFYVYARYPLHAGLPLRALAAPLYASPVLRDGDSPVKGFPWFFRQYSFLLK